MINLDAKVTRKQFLGSIGLGILSATSLGIGTGALSPRLPSLGEYGWGTYGERHYG
jgi:hypothetical protein